eukprot:403339769
MIVQLQHARIFGCIECQISTVSTNEFLTCSKCADNLYLLANNTNSDVYPAQHSFCVQDCREAHQSFINNPVSQTCQWCGQGCQSCNINTGCEMCPGEIQNKGWVSALNFQQSNVISPNFRMCQACLNDQCDQCSPIDTTQCQSCSYPVNQTSNPNYPLSCSPLSESSLSSEINCEIFDFADEYNCLKCKPGYYIDTSYYNLTASRQQSVCSQCNHNFQSYSTDFQEEVCLDALGQYDCQNCIYGYSTFSHNGENRCYSNIDSKLISNIECFNDDILYPEAVRCSFIYNDTSSEVDYEKTTGCLDSFVDPLTGSCTTNCGVGRFGETNLTLRGMTETSTCQECDVSCYECAGYGSNMCISCPQGFYLEYSDISKSFGTCQIKSGTQNLTIYVLPMALYYPLNPPFSMNGTQDYPFYSINDALLRAEEFGAPFQESTVLITLFNQNNLPHAMLRQQPMSQYQTLKSDKYSQTTKIIIDTIDQSQVKVLYKQRDTFTFKIGPSLTIKNLIFDAIDSSVDLELDLTDHCLIPFGGSFIQFDINENSMITQPQVLQLENVTFKNFIYEFNSFIELNDYGGYVNMKNVEFENINSCGSIIRNKKPLSLNKTYENAQIEIVQLFQQRLNNLQYEINQKHELQLGSFNPFTGVCSDDKTLNLPPCFQLIIDKMTVTRMESMKDPSSDVIAVDPNYGMQFTGSVLDLNNFKGPIILKNSNFSNNYATFRDSSLGLKLFKNEFPSSDNYPSLGTQKLKLQMKSLITIINHQNHRIDIINNTFYNNSQINGLITLQINHRNYQEDKILIYNNSFSNQLAFLDSAVLNIQIKSRQNTKVNEYVFDPVTPSCHGVGVIKNKIVGSVGSSGTSGGSIKIECVDDTTETQSNSLTNYQQITDLAIKESRFNFNYTSLAPQLIQESEIYDNISYDYLMTSFIGNTLKNSTASAQRGLINMINVPRLNMSDNLYELILDNFAIDTLSPQTKFIVSASILDLTSNYIFNYYCLFDDKI